MSCIDLKEEEKERTKKHEGREITDEGKADFEMMLQRRLVRSFCFHASETKRELLFSQDGHSPFDPTPDIC
jgi:hypothetical protein